MVEESNPNRFERREAIIVTEGDNIKRQFATFVRTVDEQMAEALSALKQYDNAAESDQNKQDWLDLVEFHNNYASYIFDAMEFFNDELDLAISKALLKSRTLKVTT